jgi:hypothetical protein
MMDPITAIIALVITGIGVGFASGLLGIGGCFIMVPVQYWIYTSMGLSPDIAIRVAFGTNLLVVLPTVISGAYGHSKKGAVLWRAGIVLGITSAIGAVIGATIAVQLPGAILKVAFGLVIFLSAIRMLTAKPPKIDEKLKDKTILWAAWAFPIGIVSGIIGIGGGIMMIPMMLVVLKFRMHQAVGTSTAIMIFTSTGGVIGYIINGLGVEGLPAYSIGYVNFSSWFVLAVTSVMMAQVGVRVSHKIPARELKYIFIAVMMYFGLKMLGVFDWLGLPI